MVTDYRRESVALFSRGSLEVSSTSSDLEAVDGLDHVVTVIRDVVAAMNEGDLRRVPRRLLFLGTPGTGRMMATELLAGHGNMAFAQLKNAWEIGEEYMTLGSQQRSYECNLKFAINFIRTLAPVVVFMEDIDQIGTLRADAQPDYPDSTLPIELLNAISDPSLHGKMIWIGVSNRPDAMHPIFRRFDYKLVFLPPTAGERAALLSRLFKDFGIDVQHINFGRIAADQYMNGLSSRALSIIVQRSYNIAKQNVREAVTEADLMEALTDYVPEYSPGMNEFLGLLALQEANSRSMMPTVLPLSSKNILKATGSTKRRSTNA